MVGPSSISALAKFKRHSLNNWVEDISALGEFTELEELNLAFTRVKDIELLTILKKLKKFNLSDTEVTKNVENFEHLAQLTTLEELSFGKNQFDSLAEVEALGNAISRLPQLKNLNLCETGIKDDSGRTHLDIRSLFDAPQGGGSESPSVLSHIDLSGIEVLHIESLKSALKQLRYIYLNKKQIRNQNGELIRMRKPRDGVVGDSIGIYVIRSNMC